MTGRGAMGTFVVPGRGKALPAHCPAHNPFSVMNQYTLKIDIETKEPLTEEEIEGLRAVVEHGTVIDALQTKAGVESITGARVTQLNRMTAELEDIKANEAVYGDAANEEEAERFEVTISAGRQIVLTFDREKEEMPRELLIEHQAGELSVIAVSERDLDADAIVTVHEESTTIESNTTARDGRTYNGTKPVG